MMLAAQDFVDMLGRLVKDVDGFADNLIDGNGEMLLQ